MALFSKQNFKRDQPIKSLREVISMSRTSETLRDIPDRLTNIIERYDDLSLAPQFRQDVFNVIMGALDVAESLVDETFPAEHANEQIAVQLEIIARISRHLQRRPSKMGFTILIPENNQMVGHFNTEGEAHHHLEGLQNMGMARSAQVVPVKILSQHAIQPRFRPPSAPATVPQPEPLSGPVPGGIIPRTATSPPQQGPALDFDEERVPGSSPPSRPEIPQVQPTTPAHPASIAGRLEAAEASQRTDALEASIADLLKPKPGASK